MRVHVVSDVHGSAAALASAGNGADALVVLGDLLLYVDYADPSLGMVAELFGEDAAHEFAALRRDHRFREMRAFGARLMERTGDPRGAIFDVARRQYAELFAALPPVSYLTYGNVDIPALWPEFGRRPLDGEVVEIGGWTFGFVGGWVPRHPPPPAGAAERSPRSSGGLEGAPPPAGAAERSPRSSGGVEGAGPPAGAAERSPRSSGGVEGAGPPAGAAGHRPPPGTGGPALRFGAECTAEEYAAKVAAVGAVDVLCSHVPPAVPELRYDTVTGGFETASEAILDAIRTTAPRYALFGHVHQPLQRRLRIGRTECINVGHFRKSGEPFVLQW